MIVMTIIHSKEVPFARIKGADFRIMADVPNKVDAANSNIKKYLLSFFGLCICSTSTGKNLVNKNPAPIYPVIKE